MFERRNYLKATLRSDVLAEKTPVKGHPKSNALPEHLAQKYWPSQWESNQRGKGELEMLILYSLLKNFLMELK